MHHSVTKQPHWQGFESTALCFHPATTVICNMIAALEQFCSTAATIMDSWLESPMVFVSTDSIANKFE